jgi:hypothetical protein
MVKITFSYLSLEKRQYKYFAAATSRHLMPAHEKLSQPTQSINHIRQAVDGK